MNLNFQHIINESIGDNPKIENMMFHLFNREFMTIWTEENDDPNSVGFKNDNITDILSYFGEMVALDYEVILYFFLKWTLDPNSKWTEEGGGNIFSEFEIEEFSSFQRGDGYIYDKLKKVGWFDKKFVTGASYKDEKILKTNYYDNMSFNDTEGLYPNMVLSVDGWDEFVELFKNRDFAEQAFSEDHSDFFSYYDTPMDEMVTDMTPKAMDSIIESMPAYTDKIMIDDDISDELYEMGVEVDTDSDFLELNKVFIDKIKSQIKNKEVDGEEILLFLLERREFSGLRGDISSAYDRAINDLVESDIFSSGKSEIIDLFDGKPEWVENTKSGDSARYDLKVPIPTELIDKVLEHYIDVEGTWPEERESYFLDALKKTLDEEMDLLSLPNLDYYYPDSSQTEKWFEESLYNYLEMSA